VLHTDEFESISQQIKQLLAVHPMDLKHLVDSVIGSNENKIIHTIQLMTDNEIIHYDEEQRLSLVNN
jgi:hypothetical protein